MKKIMLALFTFSAAAIVVFLFAGCGVKGDPVPPVTPAEIGRGRPKFEEISNPTNRKAPLTVPKNKEDPDDTND